MTPEQLAERRAFERRQRKTRNLARYRRQYARRAPPPPSRRSLKAVAQRLANRLPDSVRRHEVRTGGGGFMGFSFSWLRHLIFDPLPLRQKKLSNLELKETVNGVAVFRIKRIERNKYWQDGKRPTTGKRECERHNKRLRDRDRE